MSKKRFDSTALVKTDLKGGAEAPPGGWVGVQKVEEIRHGIKFDMLGAIDVMAWDRNKNWLGVNGCLESTAIQHMIDAQNNKELKEKWLDLGYRFCLFIYPDKEDRDEGETGHRTIYFEDFGKENSNV